MDLSYILNKMTPLSEDVIRDILMSGNLEEIGWKLNESGKPPNADVDYVVMRDGRIMQVGVNDKVLFSWNVQNTGNDIVAYHVPISEKNQVPVEDNGHVELKEYNERFKNGEGIEDEELEALLEFYKDLEEKLSLLGPEFDLAKNEVRQRLRVLQSFSYHRNFHCE